MLGAKTPGRGFTLIETLIAIVVISTSLIGNLMMLTRGTALGTQGYELMIAQGALQEQIERIRGLNVAQVNALHNTNFTVAALANSQGTISVSDALAAGTPNGGQLRRVTVQLEWDEAGGRTVTQETATFVTWRGLNKIP